MMAVISSGHGKELTSLLIKAAGLDGKRVKSLECRVATGEAITFTAELYGLDEDIGPALASTKSEAERMTEFFKEGWAAEMRK
jgi:hypothetical protein